MTVRAHIGRRQDSKKVVEAFLHDSTRAPRVRVMTEDRVRVEGSNPFDLDLGSINDQDFVGRRVVVEQGLTKALGILISCGLTERQRRELNTQMPDLTVREGER